MHHVPILLIKLHNPHFVLSIPVGPPVLQRAYSSRSPRPQKRSCAALRSTKDCADINSTSCSSSLAFVKPCLHCGSLQQQQRLAVVASVLVKPCGRLAQPCSYGYSRAVSHLPRRTCAHSLSSTAPPLPRWRVLRSTGFGEGGLFGQMASGRARARDRRRRLMWHWQTLGGAR